MASRAAERFTFDPTAHAYFVGRRRLPSITQIIAAGRASDAQPWAFSDEAAERGDRIHRATASFDLGAGWGDDLLDVDVPRVRAYADFLQMMQPVYDEIEQPRWSRALQFAGTPDRVGRWRDGRRFVLDIKTGAKSSEHGLQTAGQVLVVEGRPDARLRYSLHLRPEGDYRLVSWTDARDYVEFMRRLRIITDGGAYG